jgi:ABC-type nitrate/sulfonate/bicarbonate transport system ATPase subunit
MDSAVRVDRLEKTLRGGAGSVEVLAGISFDVPAGSWVTCIGPSGCGKTTLLRVIAGLLEPDRGAVHVTGATRGRLGSVAYLPQHETLLPWRRAVDNAILASQLDGRSRQEAVREAQRLFDRFGLQGFERHYPSQLSGGMRQRLALIRTFLTHRKLLLLDEPLGALDPLTRSTLQAWLLDVWSELRATILLVTHDVEEALYLSDRLLILTPRPATVRDDLPLGDLPRPRLTAEVDFVRRRNELVATLLEGGPVR